MNAGLNILLIFMHQSRLIQGERYQQYMPRLASSNLIP